MKNILTVEEMQYADSYTEKNFHVPSIVLMERAAQNFYKELGKENVNFKKVLVVCGSGNNGGDGFAIARILYEKKVDVSIVFNGTLTSMSAETRENYNSCSSYKIPINTSIKETDYTLIVDALFGIGINRPIDNKTARLITDVNNLHKNGCYVASVDIPSGVNADTGEIMGTAINADLTVTFAFYKRGLLLYPGALNVGKLILTDIGITEKSLDKLNLNMFCMDRTDIIKANVFKRKENANKASMGKVLLVVGNENMYGCAYLAALSALRMGCGMVRIYTHKENKALLNEKLPEAIVDTYETSEDLEKLAEAVKWADVIGIGPGIGKNKIAKNIFEFVFFKSNKPLIVDADAIYLLKKYMLTLKKEEQRDIVITPHVGELSKFLDVAKEDVIKNFISISVNTSNTFHLTLVAKDARTIIASNNKCFINVTGNSGMAVAGMGDSLLGIICAIRARGFDSTEACKLGCFIHGYAGDLAAKEVGENALITTDLINQLKNCPEAIYE